ncbi:uncharacterized protein LOC128961588 [Oppia nitens]|uniref:uncharacterized protein LOC128961588 n=1 Tax=Oppia nitens TaxID=1686743 RepID=UPI0023DC1190|nr:uncharacterized protein LOC128961588 [Oppia nitens]
MFVKNIFKCLSIIMIMITTNTSFPLQDILCFKPSFTSITPISHNNSYFMVSNDGYYWSSLTDDSVFKSEAQMKEKGYYSGKVDTIDIDVIQVDNISISKTFDLTFRINFNGICNLESETLFATKLFGYTNWFGYKYINNKWTKLSDKTLHPVINRAMDALKPNRRIKAVLNFDLFGVLFIQGLQ